MIVFFFGDFYFTVSAKFEKNVLFTITLWLLVYYYFIRPEPCVFSVLCMASIVKIRQRPCYFAYSGRK